MYFVSFRKLEIGYGSKFDLEVYVFMVKVSYNQKTFKKVLMEIFDDNFTTSPNNITKIGKKLQENHLGNLDIVISTVVIMVMVPD
ncbi:hypothetical protein [Thermotoga profunda]|uniref:hypothetical protein n=1 Tax=Thermotoga profunda TaxID=1508420 RepID=UPI000597D426|nr:hypothetical protein [Thermotoga profunda]